MLAPPIGAGGFFVVPVMLELLLPHAAAATMMPMVTNRYGRICILRARRSEHTSAQQSFLHRGARAPGRRDTVNDMFDRADVPSGAISDASFCPLASPQSRTRPSHRQKIFARTAHAIVSFRLPDAGAHQRP